MVWWEDAGPEGKRRGKACSVIGKSTHTHLDSHIVYDTWTHTQGRVPHTPTDTYKDLSTGGASGKEPACNAGDVRDIGSIPGLGRSPGGGNGNPLQYPCLEKPMDRGDCGLWSMELKRVGHN